MSKVVDMVVQDNRARFLANFYFSLGDDKVQTQPDHEPAILSQSVRFCVWPLFCAGLEETNDLMQMLMGDPSLTVDVSRAVPGGNNFKQSCWLWGLDPCLETINLMSNALSAYVICAHGKLLQITAKIENVVKLWQQQDQQRDVDSSCRLTSCFRGQIGAAKSIVSLCDSMCGCPLNKKAPKLCRNHEPGLPSHMAWFSGPHT